MLFHPIRSRCSGAANPFCSLRRAFLGNEQSFLMLDGHSEYKQRILKLVSTMEYDSFLFPLISHWTYSSTIDNENCLVSTVKYKQL